MNTGMQYSKIRSIFPSLADISAEEWEACEPIVKRFPEKTVVFDAKDFDHFSIFLLQGTVRIVNLSESGRTESMNRISEGDVCSLMVLSTLSQREYLGFMTSETPIEALFVRKSYFIKWIGMYPNFRKFIFENILDGFIHITGLLHNVLFQRVDLRLAKWLFEKTSVQQLELRMTHEEIAMEIGTAREVVSRLLKRFKDEGIIVSRRGYLKVIEREKLNNLG